MTTLTQNPWAAARSLADLGGLTARWLEGDLDSSPSYPTPDEETAGLVPVLAAANRAGLLTLSSQPGQIDTGGDGVWRQRASVTLLMQTPTHPFKQRLPSAHLLRGYGCPEGPWGRLVDADHVGDDIRLDMTGHDTPDDTPLCYIEHEKPPRRYNFDRCWPISTFDGEVETHDGGGFSRAMLREEILPGVGPAALAKACRAYQFTLIDPVYGRNDRLWPLLAAVAEAAVRGEQVADGIEGEAR